MNIKETLKENVIIEGEYKHGVSFKTHVILYYNPHEETPEQALIRTFGYHVNSFEELVVKRGWLRANWTYPTEEEIEDLIFVEEEEVQL